MAFGRNIGLDRLHLDGVCLYLCMPCTAGGWIPSPGWRRTAIARHRLDIPYVVQTAVHFPDHVDLLRGNGLRRI